MIEFAQTCPGVQLIVCVFASVYECMFSCVINCLCFCVLVSLFVFFYVFLSLRESFSLNNRIIVSLFYFFEFIIIESIFRTLFFSIYPKSFKRNLTALLNIQSSSVYLKLDAGFCSRQPNSIHLFHYLMV